MTVPKKETLAQTVNEYRSKIRSVVIIPTDITKITKRWLRQQKEEIEDIRCDCPICNGIRAYNKVIDDLLERAK